MWINVQSDFSNCDVLETKEKKNLFSRFLCGCPISNGLCYTMRAGTSFVLVCRWMFVCLCEQIWVFVIVIVYLLRSFIWPYLSSNNKLLSRLFLDRNRPARQIPWFNTMLRISEKKSHTNTRTHTIWISILWMRINTLEKHIEQVIITES